MFPSPKSQLRQTFGSSPMKFVAQNQISSHPVFAQAEFRPHSKSICGRSHPPPVQVTVSVNVQDCESAPSVQQ